MAAVSRDDAQRRDVNIKLRVPEQVKEMIDRAASLLGKSRSEFIVDSARTCAEDVLLNQRSFMLDETRHAALVKCLNEPPEPTDQLRKLLASKSPWEE
jgi:uncharacterized protein (DUF1778 family)